MRLLCLILLAVAIGAASLLLADQNLQAQSTSQAQRALDVPYTKYMDPAERDALLDTAAAAGADSIKTEAPWDHLEPSQDDAYSWGFMDDFMAAAEARGLEVHMQVAATPDWVHLDLVSTVPDRSSRVWHPPRGATEVGYWRDFVRDLVTRYGTRVSSYEMWNEPNHEDFWRGGSGPNPAEYAAMLRAGYLGAKQANPNVVVIGGSLSQNDIGYTNALYEELRRYPDAAVNDDFFDAYGVHPYAVKSGEPLAPDHPASEANYTGPFGQKNSAFLGIDYIKQTLDAHGDSHKKLWLGEFGYSTLDGWMSPTPDSTRAEWLKKAYALLDARPYVIGMSWYSYYGDTDRGFNIYDRATGQKTLTFRAFREVTLGSTRPVSSETLRFSPMADARVYEYRPDKNYGLLATTLIADGGTGIKKRSYLKFAVSGLNGRQVRSATLRVFVKADGGSNDGPGVRRAGNAWREESLTWHNQPGFQSGMVADQRSVPGEAWLDFNVTSLVTQDGTITLAILPTSTDGTYMSSREGANEPQLVLNVGS